MDRKISGRISNAFRLASVAVLAEVRTTSLYTQYTQSSPPVYIHSTHKVLSKHWLICTIFDRKD